jgi:hypothetical protein
LVLAFALLQDCSEAHMSRSGHRLRSEPGDGVLRIMTIANLAIAAGVFIAWPTYADALANPMSLIAASGPPIRPGVFEYPYFLLWAAPVFGVCGTYVARSMGIRGVARLWAFFPVVLAISCAGWLYLVEGYWS